MFIKILSTDLNLISVLIILFSLIQSIHIIGIISEKKK